MMKMVGMDEARCLVVQKVTSNDDKKNTMKKLGV